MLDGAPAEEETQKRLQEDEVKTKLLEQVILRLATPKKIPSVPDGSTLSTIPAYVQSQICASVAVFIFGLSGTLCSTAEAKTLSCSHRFISHGTELLCCIRET